MPVDPSSLVSRRRFLRLSSAALPGLALAGCIARPLPVKSPYGSAIPAVETGTRVNDLHSQLNATEVGSIVKPATIDALREAVLEARASGTPVAIAGGRHAMGGQQFVTGGLLVDTRALNRVLDFDAERGMVSVEAGIQWPELMAWLERARETQGHAWGIVQKQTGADRLSLGGALACNAHGRGLALKPIIEQVESFDLLEANGEIRTCSRGRDPELFGLAIGGYGLFGPITAVRLRLGPRVKVRRVVALTETASVMDRFEARIREGHLYGDFQFATDAGRDSFLRRGVFATYQPVAPGTPLTADPARLTPEDWARLTFYSHRYKRRAFDVYTSRYLETSGQVYWSDAQLAASYVDDYHADLDRALGARHQATEMISEIYVPRPRLAAFMEDARAMLRDRRANLIYGTVRLIERDDESFLAWARARWACVIFNLHVEHTASGIAAAADTFRDLIDLGLAHGGSYYLTYHRWARRDQVERAYPQMREFLARKRRHDPEARFQSDWYRHHL
jgi:FAD/FMN-containing dehydrogenase